MAKMTPDQFVKKMSKKLDVDTELEVLRAEPVSIENFLDTGSAVLNATMSGTVKGGASLGKITGFYGPSTCGKSYIVGKLAADAVEKGMMPIIFDSEGAWGASSIGFGIKPGTCVIYRQEVIEIIKNQIFDIVNENKKELESGEFRPVVFLDSLAALVCQKEVDDTEKGSTAVDMGTRAKQLRAMFRNVRRYLKRNNIAFIWTNHTYDNPAELRPSAIKKMPGGYAPWYFADVLVMMGRREVKNTSGEHTSFRNSGAEIPVECVKQRFVQPFIKNTFNLDYKGGLLKYSGLFEVAKDLNVIQGDKTYTLNNPLDDKFQPVKLGWRKSFEDDKKIWEEQIIPILDPVIMRAYSFGSEEFNSLNIDFSALEEAKQIEKEIAEQNFEEDEDEE